MNFLSYLFKGSDSSISSRKYRRSMDFLDYKEKQHGLSAYGIELAELTISLREGELDLLRTLHESVGNTPDNTTEFDHYNRELETIKREYSFNQEEVLRKQCRARDQDEITECKLRDSDWELSKKFWFLGRVRPRAWWDEPQNRSDLYGWSLLITLGCSLYWTIVLLD